MTIKRRYHDHRDLPGGVAHSLVHVGPYENLTESYKKVIDYMQERAITTDTPSREIYLKAPGMIFKGNPQKYQTEIQMFEG
ncbi:MAG: GyrI-like domain-containing protein [Fibrobacterales bacterium]